MPWHGASAADAVSIIGSSLSGPPLPCVEVKEAPPSHASALSPSSPAQTLARALSAVPAAAAIVVLPVDAGRPNAGHRRPWLRTVVLLLPRSRNRSGRAAIAASVHVSAAAGRARRAPSPPLRSSSCLADHGNVLVVSYWPCCASSPSFSPSVPRSPLAPPPAAAILLAAGQPVTKWSKPPPPSAPLLPLYLVVPFPGSNFD